MPKIIILVATYNRQNLVKETLLSIASQTLSDFECFIVDDNSTDDTQSVVEAFCNKDHRFSFYNKPKNLPKGLPASRNYGLDLVKNKDFDALQFFDDDDIMHPEKLEMQYNLLVEKNLDVVLCGSQSFRKKCIPETTLCDLPIVQDLNDDYLTGKINFVAQVPLFRKNYVEILRFDNSLAYAEEWEFFVRLFYSQNPRVDVINQVLFYRRKHEVTMMTVPDYDFKKRMSASVVRVKLAEFLTINELHTKKSLIFMANNFLLNNYKLQIVDSLIDYAKRRKGISQRSVFLMKINRVVVGAFRKLIFKVSSLS